MATRSLDLIFTSNATAAVRGFVSLGGAANAAERKFGKAGRVMTQVFTGAAIGAAAFTAKSVSAFIDFDDAMTKSLAIMGDISGPMRRRMEDAAKAVARTTTFSATEAAEAFYGLASAGLTAEQSVDAIGVVAAFAQAGNVDLAEATDYLADAQAALGLRMDDPIANMREMKRVSDVLTMANNLATGSMEDFAEALTNKAAAALKTTNKSIEEGVAVLALLAERGVHGATAGEKLSIALRDIPRAAARNKEEFAKFGVAVFDSSGNLKNMADIVAEFEGALGPMNDSQRASTLEQMGMTRSVGDVIRQLLGGSDAIREYQRALEGAGGATQQVADRQMESLRSKIELVKNKLNVLMIDFGEPVAIWLVETFMPWLEEKFIPKMKELGSVVKKDVQPSLELLGQALNNPAFIKALAAFTGFATGVIAVNKALKILTKVFAPVLFVAARFTAILDVIKHPVTALRLALLPLAPIFKVIGGVVASVASAIQVLGSVLFSSIGITLAAVAAVVIFRERIIGVFSDLWDRIYSAFIGPLVRFFTGPFMDFWRAVWRNVEGPLRVFLNVLQVIMNVAIAHVAGPFIIMAGLVYAVVSNIVIFVTRNFHNIWSVITAVWNAIVAATRWTWETVIMPVLRFVWDFIVANIRVRLLIIRTIIVTAWNVIRTVTVAVWNAIKAALLAAWHFIRDRVAKPTADYWNAYVVPRFQAFRDFIGRLWSGIKGAFLAAWHWIRDNVIKPFMNYWNDVVMPRFRDIKAFFGRIWEGIKSTASSVWRGILNAVKTPVNGIIRVMNALISGINTVIGLINRIPGVEIPSIPKIPTIGSTASGASRGGRGGRSATSYGMAAGGIVRGGITNGPEFLVGEGNSAYPEAVIATDPRYRQRNMGYLAWAAQQLGVPGFQFGGIVNAVKGGISGAINAAGGFVDGVARGALKRALSPFNRAAKAGLDRIPNAFRLRAIAQGFRKLLWEVITGADAGFPEEQAGGGPGGNANYRGGGGVERWRATALRALRMTNSPASWIGSLLRRMNQESGGNPNAINLWDSNAMRGDPSGGLMQNIRSAYASRVAGFPSLRGTNMFHPLGSIVASIVYTKGRYGSGPRGWDKSGGYENGLWSVPWDDFPARLHRGERVLPADVAAEMDRQAASGGGPMLNIEKIEIRGPSDADLVRNLERELTWAWRVNG